MKIYKECFDIFQKMHHLFNHPLVRKILKLKYQCFKYKLSGWILLLIVIVSIIWGTCDIVLWIRNSCCCTLSYFIVTGKRHYTTNHDIHCIIKKVNTLGTFINQDVNIIQKKIECFPWVQQVSIRTQWPDTLKINVIEHIPAAFWNDTQIISVTGIVFDFPEGYQNYNDIVIPILYGPGGSEQEILIHYYIFDAILKKSTNLQIKSLQMDTRYSWQLVLKNNMYIKLGRKNIIERLNYFVKIYPILLYKMNESNKCIDYIDVRYTAGFVVKWIPNAITSILYKQ